MEYRNDWSEFRPRTFEYNGKWIKNWFSNMIPSPIFIGGSDWEWPSVENYYQAMKSEAPEIQQMIKEATPQMAKQLGKRIALRPDWELIKEDKMKYGLLIKFQQSPWYEALMATGDTQIIEWNNWGDKYWGADHLTGKGLNRLGCLLMQLRAEFKQQALEYANRDPLLGLGMSDEQREKI